MPKTDGDMTKKRILQVAEKLFSEMGFDGTSVDRIAKNTGINKGSIYYHFKDKNDILDSLFQNIINDMDENLSLPSMVKEESSNDTKIEEKVKAEIEYLDHKKKILAILMMETLKSESTTDSFIKCMEIIIKKELNGILKRNKIDSMPEEEVQKFMVYEFFTGIIPVISFITLKDKWCQYYDYDENKLLEYFMEAFLNSHIKSHKHKD